MNNKLLQETNGNIKLKVLKLIRSLQEQYNKDSEEQTEFLIQVKQIEIQNQYLRDTLQIASLNDTVCDQINKVLEEEEEEIQKNQEPPNQDKILEKLRNKKLIERIKFEEENYVEENEDFYLKKLVKDQRELEQMKSQEDKNSMNNMFGLVLAQANKNSDMRDLAEDQCMESSSNGIIQQQQEQVVNQLVSTASSEEKNDLSTGSSFTDQEINLNNSLLSNDSNDSRKNSASLINSQSILNQPNKGISASITLPNQTNSQNSKQNPPSPLKSSQIFSQSLGSPQKIPQNSQQNTSNTSQNQPPSNLSPQQGPRSLISSSSLLTKGPQTSSTGSLNPPKIQNSIRGNRSIFSDISSRVGGHLGSSSLSPSNRLKSPNQVPHKSSLSKEQKIPQKDEVITHSLIMKNLEQIHNSPQNNDSQIQNPVSEQKDISPRYQKKQQKVQSVNEDKVEETKQHKDAFSFDDFDNDDNYNILEDNDDNDGPLNEEDFSTPNSYENNINKQQEENQQKETQQISNLIQSDNQNNLKQGNSFINSKSIFSSATSNIFGNALNKNNSGNISNSNITNNNNNNINNVNNNNNQTNSNNTINNIQNNKNSNPAPQINSSSFISSSSFFSSNGSNFQPFSNNIQTEKKKSKDDEIILIKYDNESSQQDDNDTNEQQNVQKEEKQVIEQSKQNQQNQQNEEISFTIPLS